MIPEFLDRTVDGQKSYVVTDFKDRHFIDVWHYHEQVEIVATLKSRGTRFVGDSIDYFKPGQIVVLGGNLPHMWKNDRDYFAPDSDLKAQAVTIHLGNKLVSMLTQNVPELMRINRLLLASRRGILVPNDNKIFLRMKRLPSLSGIDQFLAVIEVLNLIGSHETVQYLASEGFVMNSDNNSGRLRKIHQYVMNEFRTGIELKEAARRVHMNPTSFSRYFSNTYGKSFIDYVNDVKIGFARKLLIESRMNVTDICFESGFRNVSNFNRQFKQHTDLTPTEFRKKYEQIN